MKTSHFLLIPFLFLALAPESRSVTIYDNGIPDQASVSHSDFGPGPGVLLAEQSGDDFTLSMTATAGQIQWWGAYLPFNTPTEPDNFTIRFFTMTGGVPATTPLFSYAVGDAGRVDSGTMLPGI